MVFRRSPRFKSAAPCQACVRIRTFLAVAAILIIAMPILAETAAPIAILTPMNFALAIMGLGLLAFFIKLIAWRLERAQEQSLNITSVQQK